MTPPGDRSPRYHLAAVLLAAGIALGLGMAFLWEVHLSIPVTVDDAYITFSFSKNVAQGHGPVYGHGVVVEGYSNFLWMLIVALGLVIRPLADPVAIARVAALPFVCVLALCTYRLCRERARAAWAVAAVALLLVNADVITAFQVGLETLPYAALLALSFMLYVRSLHDPAFRRWVVPAFVAAALMRIDGFLPLGFILVFEMARRGWKREGTVREYAIWALPALCLYLAWFVWRWHTYGLLFPSTYYAKALIPKVLPHRGWEYLRSETLASGSFLALPFAAILLLRRPPGALAIVLYSLGHALYVTRVGGDWMPYGRFVLPILPLVLVIIVWGGREISQIVASHLKSRSRLVLALPAVLPIASLLFIVARTEGHLVGSDLLRGKRAMAVEQFGHVIRLTASAKLLNLALPAGARLVTDYGGVLAYYTDAAPIEMWGLCNAMIATRGGLEGVQPIYGKTCPECYPALDPQFFHVMVPLTRELEAFKSHDEVVRNVWQTDTIGRYLDFHGDFVSGRVMIPAQNQALYFLERRRPNVIYQPRHVSSTVVVDYPFEPGGRAPGPGTVTPHPLVAP